MLVCVDAQSSSWAELPAPVAVAIAACPAASASSCVAPAASADPIACCARCAAIAASRAAFSVSACWVAALLAAASAAAACFLISLLACFSRCCCSSCSVDGSWRCPVKCSVSRRACLPLSGSRRSSRCRISGVRGIGSLPLLPLEPDVAEFAPDTDPKLSLSLSLSAAPLPCCASMS